VIVIDGETNEKIARIPAGSSIRSFCYNATNNKVYCANDKTDNVAVIDGVTDSVITTITVGDGPSGFAWNPIQNRTYVANGGASSISVLRDSVTGIEESTQNASPLILNLHPNPAKTALTIDAPTPLLGITVYDILGRLVRIEDMIKFESGITITVEHLSAGVYFVKVNTENNEFIRKVIVTK